MAPRTQQVLHDRRVLGDAQQVEECPLVDEAGPECGRRPGGRRDLVVRAGMAGPTRANYRHDPDTVVVGRSRCTGSNDWNYARNCRHGRRATIVFSRRSGGPSHLRDRNPTRLATCYERCSTARASASQTRGPVVARLLTPIWDTLGARTSMRSNPFSLNHPKTS